jgi:outer membrane protein assembly factor BamB
VVKAEPDMVTSYDIKTGKKNWSLILGGSVCEDSDQSDSNRVLIALNMGGGVCQDVVLIDIQRGVKLWDYMLLQRSASDPAWDYLKPAKWFSPLQLAVSNGQALAVWETGERVLRLSDGKVLASTDRKMCGDVRADGGDQLIAESMCGHYWEVRALDPKDPKRARWTWKAPKDHMVQTVLSTNPTVLVVSDGGGKYPRIVILNDSNGSERANIGIANDRGIGDNIAYLVADGRLFMGTKGTMSAFSLSNGKKAWTYQADPNRVPKPVAVQGEELAVYLAATPDRVGELHRVSASTGRVTRITRHDESVRNVEWEMDHRDATPYLKDGRLLLSQEGSIDSLDSKVVLAITEE